MTVLASALVLVLALNTKLYLRISFSCMALQDARDGLLGRLFAYGSMIRSRRLIGNCTSSEEKDLAKEIVQQLFNLAKLKTFLREPAVSLVIELASRVIILCHYFK